MTSSQQLGGEGEKIIFNILKKKYPKARLVSRNKKFKEDHGCDIVLDDGTRIEVKTA